MNTLQTPALPVAGLAGNCASQDTGKQCPLPPHTYTTPLTPHLLVELSKKATSFSTSSVAEEMISLHAAWAPE